MTKRISKEAEDKILNAVEKAAGLIANGTSPNDAIVKVASAAEFQPGHVQMMVQAYNTGRTRSQWKSAADLFEKSGTFPLADAATVLEALYPSTIKTASADRSGVSAEYDRPPSWLTDAVHTEKVAYAWEAPPPKASPYPRETATRQKKAEGLLRNLEQEREQYRMQVSASFDKLANAIDDLDYYFRLSGNVQKFASVANNAALLWGKHGKAVMEKVAEANPFIPKDRTWGVACMPADLTQEPYSLVKAALDAAAEHLQWREFFVQYEVSAQAAGTKLAGHYLPPVHRSHRGSILQECGPEKQAFGPAFGLMTGAGMETGKNIIQKLTPKPEDKLKTDALMALEDPAHEARLRGIRAQATLHDMLANDDFISGEDPLKVTKLYNEIVKLSPRSADQPMLVRALVRRYLAQGQVDPHDVDQLVGIETKMKMRDEPSKEQHLPKVPGSNLVTQAPQTSKANEVKS